MPGKYRLYGVEGSYYAAKVRSYLIKKPLPFEEINADRRAFNEVIIPAVGYPIIPVVVTPDGEVIQDSALIVDTLEAAFPHKPLRPVCEPFGFLTYLIELLADEWLKIPALHYRWHYDSDFASRMMGENNDPDASVEDQQKVGKKIAANFNTWPKHLGAGKTTIGAIEELLLVYLEILNQLFSVEAYTLGESATLADCALMGPLYAHLFRDPYSGILVRKHAPAVCEWIERMHRRGRDQSQADYKISPHLIRLLSEISADYVPMAIEAIEIAKTFLSNEASDTQSLPRYLGRHAFTLAKGKSGEAIGERSVHTTEIWKLHRLKQYYQRLSNSDKETVSELARRLRVEPLLDRLEGPYVIQKSFRFWSSN